ncbi:basic secretory family protein [Chitinophaga sp. B61]|uniref:Basic secretory family protein n=2 Tax=Chitinophaga rhizophila TaxID=2866212 RepID=A0ABS7G6A8_9BACT|nr:basic secretory family protein [Chitinophaga rhizophila]
MIIGTLGIFLLSACSKSAIISPEEASIQPETKTEGVVSAQAVPVGTVIYTSNGYQLTLTNNDPNFSETVRQKIVDIFFTKYPQLLTRFNPGVTKSIKYVIDPNYNGVAYTSGTTVTYSAAWFQNNPQDVDVATHEIMHIIQAYTGGTPGWLTEGIADLVRYRYGVNNAAAGWSLPAYSSSQHYTNAYRVTARFLAWLENRVNASIVTNLNTALRNKTYTANTWVTLTGKTVDQLWADYAANPAL